MGRHFVRFIRSFPAVFLFLSASRLLAGELESLTSKYLAPRSRTELARLEARLGGLEKDLEVERKSVADGKDRDARRSLESSITATEGAIGQMLRSVAAGMDAASWKRLEAHLMARYAKAFLPEGGLGEPGLGLEKSLAADVKAVKAEAYFDVLRLNRPKDLPAAQIPRKEYLVKHARARWRETLVLYSATAVQEEASKLAAALAAAGFDTTAFAGRIEELRLRRARLVSFSRSIPEAARIIVPRRLYGRDSLGKEDAALLRAFLLTASRMETADRAALAKGDGLAGSLVRERAQFLLGLAAARKSRLSAELGMEPEEFLARVRKVSASCRGPETRGGETSRGAAGRLSGGDESFEGTTADGKAAADRAAGMLEREPGNRFAVLELLNQRAAGRIFFRDATYGPEREKAKALLSVLFLETDERLKSLFKEESGQAAAGTIVTDLTWGFVPAERFLGRVVCVYRLEEDGEGFPKPNEIEYRKARAAYYKAFWEVTQGREAAGTDEERADWALSHGQIVVPLRLYLKTRSGKEALGQHLSSYPESVLKDYPGGGASFRELSGYLAVPWFSKGTTAQPLLDEYRARGMEGLLLALELALPGRGVGPSAAERTLRDLRDLRISPARAEKILTAAKSGKPWEAAAAELEGEGPQIPGAAMEEARFRWRIETLSEEEPLEGAAALLVHLNEALEMSRISGAAYVELRKEVLKRTKSLLERISASSVGSSWLSALFDAGIVSERERKAGL